MAAFIPGESPPLVRIAIVFDTNPPSGGRLSHVLGTLAKPKESARLFAQESAGLVSLLQHRHDPNVSFERIPESVRAFSIRELAEAAA